MLIFAKQGRLAMQSFSLRQLLDHVMDSMEPFAGSFTVDNRLHNDLLLGNEDALRGALMNLLNNAVEAGAGQIILTVRQNDEVCVCISIEDDGPGIDDSSKHGCSNPFSPPRATVRDWGWRWSTAW